MRKTGPVVKEVGNMLLAPPPPNKPMINAT